MTAAQMDGTLAFAIAHEDPFQRGATEGNEGDQRGPTMRLAFHARLLATYRKMGGKLSPYTVPTDVIIEECP